MDTDIKLNRSHKSFFSEFIYKSAPRVGRYSCEIGEKGAYVLVPLARLLVSNVTQKGMNGLQGNFIEEFGVVQ